MSKPVAEPSLLPSCLHCSHIPAVSKFKMGPFELCVNSLSLGTSLGRLPTGEASGVPFF